MIGSPAFYQRWFTSASPLNRYIGWRYRRNGRSVAETNAKKLVTAGQIVFCGTKP